MQAKRIQECRLPNGKLDTSEKSRYQASRLQTSERVLRNGAGRAKIVQSVQTKRAAGVVKADRVSTTHLVELELRRCWPLVPDHGQVNVETSRANRCAGDSMTISRSCKETEVPLS